MLENQRVEKPTPLNINSNKQTNKQTNKQNKTKQNKTKQNKTKQNKTNMDMDQKNKQPWLFKQHIQFFCRHSVEKKSPLKSNKLQNPLIKKPIFKSSLPRVEGHSRWWESESLRPERWQGPTNLGRCWGAQHKSMGFGGVVSQIYKVYKVEL